MDTNDPIACALCRWGVLFQRKTPYAECHINPPVASRDDGDAWWPTVNVDDWCGSFECDAMYAQPKGD